MVFPRIVLLSGGFGGARLVPALREFAASGHLSVIANTGDDLTWFGLRVCPDVDAILYSLAGLWNAEAGWGRRGETFRTRDALTGLGSPPWFNVGDLDLAFHLLRTELLHSGKTLTEATRELARRLRVQGVTVIPASDQPQETHVVLQDGRLLHFQEWYVRESARPAVRQVRVPDGPASPAALDALRHADAVILGPSNPVSSIGPILSRHGLSDLVRQVRCRIAVCPVVLGISPPDAAISHHARARRHLLASRGAVDTPEGIARLYAGLVQYFVLDGTDSSQVSEVGRLGLNPVTCDLLDSTQLARTLADLTAAAPPAQQVSTRG
ncbi:MAG TPA: 2-phospho-L-lactate transferase CofD family protein [Trebonia sp.]